MFLKGLEPGAKVVVEPLINVKENTAVGIFGEEQPDNQMKTRNKQPKS